MFCYKNIFDTQNGKEATYMISLSFLQILVGKEQLVLWIISGVFFSILYSIINFLTFKYLLDINPTKKRSIIFIVLDSAIKTFCTIFVPAPYYRITNMILTTILIRMFLCQNTAKCILGETINFLIIICAEVVFMKGVMVVYPDITSYLEGMYDVRYKSSLLFVILSLKIMLYSEIKRRVFVIKISEHLSKKIKETVMLVSIIETLLIFFNFVEMAIYVTDFPHTILVMDVLFLGVCFYYSIKFILKTARLEEQDTVIKNLEAYNKTLSIMYDRIRCFKHDFYNFVQGLDGYAQTNDMNGIKSMTASVLKECNSVNGMGILNPQSLNNPAIYSIITSKYYKASESTVEMNIEVRFDLQEIAANSYDFCVMLGILLDNAIEAAAESKEKIVDIKFIKNKKGNKIVKIENSYSNKDVDIAQIFEKGFSSKPFSIEHGLGLWNVKRILSHTNDLELYTSKGELFCQEIEIYK